MYLPDTSPMFILAVLFDMCRLLPLLSRSLSNVPRCILGSVPLDCVLWMIRMQSGCALFPVLKQLWFDEYVKMPANRDAMEYLRAGWVAVFR